MSAEMAKPLTIRGYGERRKLPQWGLGRSTSRQRILRCLTSNKDCFLDLLESSRLEQCWRSRKSSFERMKISAQ